MMWVLWSFIAIAAGFILYSSIQDQVPDELSFLKLGAANPSAVVSGDDNSPESNAQVSDYYASSAKHWTIVRQPAYTELVRDFGNAVIYAGQATEAPTLHVLCANQQLFVGLDPKLRVAGDEKSATLQFDGQSQTWLRDTNQRLYAQNSADVRNRLTQKTPLTVVLRFVEGGEQRFTLNTEGFVKALSRLPSACQR